MRGHVTTSVIDMIFALALFIKLAAESAFVLSLCDGNEYAAQYLVSFVTVCLGMPNYPLEINNTPIYQTVCRVERYESGGTFH